MTPQRIISTTASVEARFGSIRGLTAHLMQLRQSMRGSAFRHAVRDACRTESVTAGPALLCGLVEIVSLTR